MAGATESHIVMSATLCVNLAINSKGGHAGFTVRHAGANHCDRLYTYPDVVLVCGERQFHDQQRDMLLNPTVIIESPRRPRRL
jgi:hypothetical protein